MTTPESIVAHRMLDANLNRSMEGLRTLEDIARFQNLSAFQESYKTLRHQLRAATLGWDPSALLASRDAGNDVGRETKTAAEASRVGGLKDIGAAASQRVQQSLRALEEVAKFLYPDSASSIESIRYRAYDCNAQFYLAIQKDQIFLQQAQLYVLAHCQLTLKQFQQRIRDISQAGASIIQIRDKKLDAVELIQFACAAIESVDASTTRIIINDRADIARVTQAWGLHVGQSDLTVSQARLLVSPSTVIGLSTHDVSQVDQAIHAGADYIGCGPTFPSSTKNFDEFAGLDFLRSTSSLLQSKSSNLPAFAIGGITLENVAQVMECGFRRVALSNAIWEASNPAHATEKFRKALGPLS
jgi:thiamine-phosphate pyrophosphorylase